MKRSEVEIMKHHVDLEKKTVLVTGGAGFVGANLILQLLKEMTEGTIVSLDNMNQFYDVRLKKYRLAEIESRAVEANVKYKFELVDISDKNAVLNLFERYKADVVVNLAAQAGVRYSIEHPDEYLKSNIIGFYNILEACRNNKVEHLVAASSSSVYGGNDKIPFGEGDRVDTPYSFYAATKKSNELMAYAYSKIYDIPVTMLRFFTVYGPAGRPDMFYYSATERLARGENIQIYNYGHMKRDFTYIDDIVNGVIRVLTETPKKETNGDGASVPPYAIYNIGGENPVNLLEFVNVLQEELVRAGVLPPDYDFKGHRELVGMQPGDVVVTCADSRLFERDFGFRPQIDIRTGLRRFAEWYKDYVDTIGE